MHFDFLKMTPSKTLFYLCISFVVGICLESSFYNFAPEFLRNRALYLALGFLVLGIVTIAATFFIRIIRMRHSEHLDLFIVFGFCLLFVALGIGRFAITEFNITHNVLTIFNDKPYAVTIVGRVADAPDLRDAKQNVTVAANDLVVDGKKVVVSGKILATLSIYKTYQYQDEVALQGKLKTPTVFDDFNYKNYLLKDGIYSLLYYPKVETISTNHQYNAFTFLYAQILWIKEALRNSIYANFSGSPRLILEGVILGNNKNMTDDLRNQLNVTGLRYLTAISGVHIIIITLIMMSLLLMLGLWRGQAFYFTLIFVWLYIILTGFSASGIRAGVMGSILLLSQKLGRQNTSSRTIVLAAAIMLLLNPLLLFYDIGFQLSFLACLGIIYFKPILENLMKIITKEHARYIVEMLAVTLTAQLFILPVMAYNFGVVSLIAPLTSLLVLPIMAPLMIVGFLAASVGIFSQVASFVFALPCFVLLLYFKKVLDIFSQPWAAATVPNVSWLWIVVYYAILFGLVVCLQKIKKPKFLGF